MHEFRSHNCGQLRLKNKNEKVKLSGWIHSKRDHGNLLFIDLRDQFGLTQCVINCDSPIFDDVQKIRIESVICVEGIVVARESELINPKIETGEIEVVIEKLTLLSAADVLPMQVAGLEEFPEDIRLKYRFIDLRREKIKANILLRAKVLHYLRNAMVERNFTEVQTPILTASSPEGARDYLVPSRVYPGKFYALPQAPQQFKQLLMVAGFDKYFQIAPCFRDEDARADRSPGEFYQLDMEMSFATQEDIFNTMEPVLEGVFKNFAQGKKIDSAPFIRIPFWDSMLKYGTDKPDLRNPIIITDVTEIFKGSSFGLFAGLIEKGAIVRAIPSPNAAAQPRSWYDKLNNWARDEGMGGLGYIIYDAKEGAKGPIAKNLDAQRLAQIKQKANLKDGDAVFFACGKMLPTAKFSGLVRTKVASELDLIEKDAFRFCWIVDFPMYEFDEKTNKIEFCHNPFSMPQGGMDDLLNKNPLDILAWQYDFVCNGYETASGAIRNHEPEIMYKAFEIVGYDKNFVDNKFSNMINAFKFGAPPHGGMAPGVDRIIMLLADEPNIREVIAFPMNGKAMDILMNAPAEPSLAQLEELHIKVVMPPEVKK